MDPPRRASPTFRHRTRSSPARDGRATRSRRRSHRGQRVDGCAPTHHRDRRPGAARLRARRRRADHRDRRERAHSLATDRGCGHRPVDPQRTRRDRRTQDDLLRRQRPRTRVRARTRRERSDLREHTRRAVRSHRLQRVHCSRWSPRHAARRLGVSARGHTRTRPRTRTRSRTGSGRGCGGARCARQCG